MAKPEWGTKRLCRSCGARFYDLRRDPIVCPKCDAAADPEPAGKPRRSTTPQPAPKPQPAAEQRQAAPSVVAAAAAPKGEEPFPDDEDKTKGAHIIEDPSELGEDEDDRAEVIDSSRKKDEEG